MEAIEIDGGMLDPNALNRVTKDLGLASGQ